MDYKEVFKKIGYDKLIIIILCGVFLVVLSSPGNSKKTKTYNKTSDDNSGKIVDSQTYRKETEERLESMIEAIDGISDVSVMITLKGDNELVVLTENNKNTNQESDYQAENKKDKSTINSEEKVVYEEINNDKSPYVKQVLNPEIEGVAIIAKGADVAGNQLKITNMIMALFNIDAHKISVIGNG